MRRLTPRMMAAAVLLVIALLGGTYYLTRRVLEPPKQHDPVSVVIADFENRTNDPAFDRTWSRCSSARWKARASSAPTTGAQSVESSARRPPSRLDEVAARELAREAGARRGPLRFTRPSRQRLRDFGQSDSSSDRNVIASARGRASSKEQVLEAATRLVDNGAQGARRRGIGVRADVRHGQPLGDVSGRGASLCGGAGSRLQRQVRGGAAKRVEGGRELDPKFGVGYQIMAVASRNKGKLQDAERYINKALQLS